jgi:hypothetical protein
MKENDFKRILYNTRWNKLKNKNLDLCLSLEWSLGSAPLTLLCLAFGPSLASQCLEVRIKILHASGIRLLGSTCVLLPWSLSQSWAAFWLAHSFLREAFALALSASAFSLHLFLCLISANSAAFPLQRTFSDTPVKVFPQHLVFLTPL